MKFQKMLVAAEGVQSQDDYQTRNLRLRINQTYHAMNALGSGCGNGY